MIAGGIMNEFKNKIKNDWIQEFSELSAYTNIRLYKIIGPLIVGLELLHVNFANGYRPHFAIYPLWKENIKECFKIPIMFIEFKNFKHLQFSIAYEFHERLLFEVQECVKQQLPFFLDGNIKLSEVIDALNKYEQMPPLSAAPTSYLVGYLQEKILELAICQNSEKDIQIMLDKINLSQWNSIHFKACKIDLQNWLQKVNEKSLIKEELIANINRNKLGKKIEKLKFSELLS